MVTHTPLFVGNSQENWQLKPFKKSPGPQTQDLFMNALLQLPCEYQHRNPLEWAGSVLLHAVLIAGLIIVPLYFTDSLDLKSLQNTWLVSPAPPGPPPPPAAPQVLHAMKSVARLIQGGRMMAPSVVPKHIVIMKEEALPPDTAGGVVGGVPGGVPGGTLGGVLGGIIGGAAAPVASVPAPPAPVKRIIRVGGKVTPPRQVYSAAVVYPPIAKVAKIEGTVVIDAIIDEHGDVVEARAVSGPPLLLGAALKAVEQWKYEPTRLNGEPVSIEMQVQVHFNLQI
jgi:protein TonB